jgi:ethanolamine ammonia-lyase large subunit
VARTIFSLTPVRARPRFAAALRLAHQPNSPGDDEDDILPSILEGLPWLRRRHIGPNPASDDVETIVHRIPARVERLRLPTRYTAPRTSLAEPGTRARGG